MIGKVFINSICGNCVHVDVCSSFKDNRQKCNFYLEQRPHGEWIPCTERLPEEGVNHLGWVDRDRWVDGDDYPTRTQEAAIGWHIEGRWHFNGYTGSTKCLAWMPLPEPYKKEGDKE